MKNLKFGCTYMCEYIVFLVYADYRTEFTVKDLYHTKRDSKYCKLFNTNIAEKKGKF